MITNRVRMDLYGSFRSAPIDLDDFKIQSHRIRFQLSFDFMVVSVLEARVIQE